MGTINSKTAQNIVDYVMKIIPYNINIMDNKGIIIASGDLSRVGQPHESALKAIQNNCIEIVRKNSDTMKEGVNIPFHFRGKVAGAVGISGDTHKVTEIIQLVKCAIELLIEQEALMSSKQVAQQLKSQFLTEWVYLTSDYSAEFVARGKGLNIDVSKPYRAAIIQLPPGYDQPDLFESQYDNKSLYDYSIRVSPSSFILIFSSMDILFPHLKSLFAKNPGMLAGFGGQERIINNSLLQAHSALRIGQILKPGENMFFYSDIKYFDAMVSGMSLLNYDSKHINNLNELVSEENQYLLDTLLSYFNNNGEMNAAAEELHIHRNTLRYRMEKIHEITGLNPYNYRDLITLVCAYVQSKL